MKNAYKHVRAVPVRRTNIRQIAKSYRNNCKIYREYRSLPYQYLALWSLTIVALLLYIAV